MKSYVGKMRLPLATDCSGKCQELGYEFWTEEGEILTRFSNCESVPLEVKVEIIVNENGCIIDWTYVEFLAASMNFVRKDIALMYIVRTESEIADQLRERVRKAAIDVETEYRKWAKHSWEEIKCTPYVFASECTRHINGNCWASMRRHADEVNPGHRHNYWHIWGGLNQGFCGHAFLNGTQGITYSNCGLSTIIHELGHNFNLHHSGSDSGGEYGESTWMGSGTQRNGFNAPHLTHINLVDQKQVTRLQENFNIRSFIVNVSMKDDDIRQGETKMVEFTKNNLKRSLSLRNVNGSISVHRPDPDSRTRNWAKTWLIDTIAPGQEKELDNGVYVKHEGIVNSAANIVVKWDKSLPDPSAFEPPAYIPDNAFPITREDTTALWESVGDSLQGIDLQYDTTRNEVVGYWHSYDPTDFLNRTNDPRWFLLQGHVINNVAHVNIYTTKRRTVASDREILEIGKGHLYFLNKDTGIFRYQTDEHVRNHIILGRLTEYYDDPLYGVYEFTDRQLEGITVSVQKNRFHPDGSVVLYWHGYRFPRIFGNDDFYQNWRFATGPLGGELTVYETRNAAYNSKSPEAELVVVGTAVVTPTEFVFVSDEGRAEKYELNKLF